MSEDTLERISQEMSKHLGTTLQPQEGMLVLADDQEQNQVTLEVGAHDGLLYLISPIVRLPQAALLWPEANDDEAEKTLLAHAPVSRLMLVLNGDTQAHAKSTVALDPENEQLVLIQRLSASLSGQEVLAHIQAAGEHLDRLRAGVRAVLKQNPNTAGAH